VLKVHRASVVDGLGESGKVLGVDGKIGLLVGAGKDVLLLDEIQPAGKKRMSGADFVRGYPVKVGEVLG
jgi:methionyl-tRNA formyltransferase